MKRADTAEAATSGVFGSELTRWRLTQRFRDGAWDAPSFDATGELQLASQTRALHYAQSVFEGFKAHRQPDGSVAIFRPASHLARFNRSLARMCLPAIDEGELLKSILQLIGRCAEEVPEPPDALYVRPFVFADSADLFAGPSTTATLLVLCAPVPGVYFGADGVKLRTETKYVRAFPGGTGAVKAAGNYAAAMRAQSEARSEGYDEVVWLDPIERSYLEETGSMNLFVVQKDALVTPPAGETVLPGITRDSLLQLARDMGISCTEARIPLDPAWWADATEVFSSGTAVGCAPISRIDHAGKPLFQQPGDGPVQKRLSETLLAIKEGRAEDPHGWRVSC